MSEEEKNKIAEELKKIQDADGRLTPDAVIEAAQDENHPLHDRFDWNDSTAAHNWRRQQARQLIQSVKIEYQSDDRIIAAPVYVRDMTVENGEQGYIDAARLLGKRDLAIEVLRREIARVEAALERAYGAAAILKIDDEYRRLTERTVKSFGRLVERVTQARV